MHSRTSGVPIPQSPGAAEGAGVCFGPRGRPGPGQPELPGSPPHHLLEPGQSWSTGGGGGGGRESAFLL